MQQVSHNVFFSSLHEQQWCRDISVGTQPSGHREAQAGAQVYSRTQVSGGRATWAAHRHSEHTTTCPGASQESERSVLHCTYMDVSV